MALLRPLKEGSVRTYQEKVGLGFADILASEADADHDTIYAAWNAGLPADSIGSTQLIDGSVGTVELADLAVTTGKLAAGAVTAAKIVPGNAVRAFNATAVPQSLNITSGGWTAINNVAMTTSGGWVLLIASHGGYGGASAGTTQFGVLLGWGLDNATSPTIIATEHIFRAPGSGALEVPLPVVVAMTQPAAGAHTFYFLTALVGGASFKTGSLPGSCYAIELA
jgi:hypothetical protein